MLEKSNVDYAQESIHGTQRIGMATDPIGLVENYG